MYIVAYIAALYKCCTNYRNRNMLSSYANIWLNGYLDWGLLDLHFERTVIVSMR